MAWTGLTNFVGAFNYAVVGEGGLGYSIVPDLFTSQVDSTLLLHFRTGNNCDYQTWGNMQVSSGGARAYFQAAASAAQAEEISHLNLQIA